MILPLSTIQSFQHLCLLLPGFKSLSEFVYSMILPLPTFWSKRNISLETGEPPAFRFPRISQKFLCCARFSDETNQEDREMTSIASIDASRCSLIVFNKDRISILLHSAWITIDYVGASCRRRAGWEYSEKSWNAGGAGQPSPTIPQNFNYSIVQQIQIQKQLLVIGFCLNF